MQVDALLAVEHVNFLSEIFRLYLLNRIVSNGILEENTENMMNKKKIKNK